MYLLAGTLRPYAWGSRTAMAELFGRDPSGEPEAELWFGAHPGAPSLLVESPGGFSTLDELISSDPEAALGRESVAQHGPELPFLAKVLAAGSPLSLQVHPTQEQARAGFEAEDAAGVDRSAANRNYKDPNHKPEMIFALSDFEALCGFRSPEDAAQLFRALAALVEASGRPAPALLVEAASDLESGRPEAERLEKAFRRLIAGDEDARDAVATAAAALRSLDEGARAGLDPALAGLEVLDGYYPQDPGVLISLLLNRVSLAPGEAIYLPAGNVHAYLSGLGVEVMASSDNVLRGGLTPKHVDIPELLQTIDFQSLGIPRVEAQTSGLGQEVYRPPFSEFALQRLELVQSANGAESMSASDVPVLQNGPTLVIALRGSVVLDSPKQDLVLHPGDCAFIPAEEAPVIAKLAAHSAQHDDGALAFAVTVGASGAANVPDEPQLDL
ncbi:mannose-6-phosphate isomerase, class I [Arthrobacter caoxuetaonis]|uniref:mannose-6-phosphate isomerase, class I n=1 Tax=Arthrobacter caoxuetaonis TaxID=2886935 RepID=UPI001D14CDC1|nr:mannose-6-phosphate isomerase, class I [Arthrobacter caoxuetaonis]MCC3282315.1 mannose-6-phosphate isomerase, class I [Arthrobacter caoxuetaonis]